MIQVGEVPEQESTPQESRGVEVKSGSISSKILLRNPAALRKLNFIEVIAIQRISHLAEIL
jgi:hypothetical protein